MLGHAIFAIVRCGVYAFPSLCGKQLNAGSVTVALVVRIGNVTFPESYRGRSQPGHRIDIGATQRGIKVERVVLAVYLCHDRYSHDIFTQSYGTSAGKIEVRNDVLRTRVPVTIFQCGTVAPFDTPCEFSGSTRISSREGIFLQGKVSPDGIGHDVRVEQFEVCCFVPYDTGFFSGCIAGVTPQAGAIAQLYPRRYVGCSFQITVAGLQEGSFVFFSANPV